MADKPKKREGKLSIPLSFDEAMKAALEVKPSQKKPKKKRAAKRKNSK